MRIRFSKVELCVCVDKMSSCTWLFCAAILLVVRLGDSLQPYLVDDIGGYGRRFDGIGGLSGGGATSRLLVSYAEKQRNEILDLLFKPKFGASLQILKVEIGGDAQSTDGTESSHMHSATDENYQRGYEWWLMTEAKKRNPDIKLYALSWAYPAWVGNGSGSPYTDPKTTATYVAKWILGAKSHYDLTIDYVGIWNERPFNVTYIKTLRRVLDSSGLQHVEIVAADSAFSGISLAMLGDKDLNASVSIVGAHYPGTLSDDSALATHKPLWASEDFSTFNDDVGAGCWGRILNQNYVNGQMTSTISWNLIASYYYGLPFFRDGLMTAVEPWSGHYDIMGPVWVSAHTTQFSEPGYCYLQAGHGVGHLDGNGSYVTLFDRNSKDFTIIIETMSHDHSVCIRPSLPAYSVKPQSATFKLQGSFASVTQLTRWTSQFSFSPGSSSHYFMKGDSIKVVNGEFTVNLAVDQIVTLTTLTGQQKGSFVDVPASMPFPVPYHDNFDDYTIDSEASLFADQSGVFEIRKAADTLHGNTMKQVVPERPITWCNDANQPITILGNITWTTAHVKVSFMLESEATSAFLAARVSEGGCNVAKASGVFFWAAAQGYWNVTTDLAYTKRVGSGNYDFKVGTWYTLEMVIQGTTGTFSIDSKQVLSVTLPSVTKAGFVGFGTGGFYSVDFDNFFLLQASSDMEN